LFQTWYTDFHFEENDHSKASLYFSKKKQAESENQPLQASLLLEREKSQIREKELKDNLQIHGKKE
jgi:hypothetical protein